MPNWPNPFRRESSTALAEVTREWRVAGVQVELLTERLAELENALDEQGWVRAIDGDLDRDFSRSALRELTKLARLSYLKNPLIRRATNLHTYYVWGRGVEISARLAEFNEVIQAFLDDEGNAAAVTGTQARKELDRERQLAGNLFFVLFPNPSTGFVQVRTLPFDEIAEKIVNPEDRQDVWYYRREWAPQQLNASTGELAPGPVQVAYYPDWHYRPAGTRPETIGRWPVKWDSPVYHRKSGGLPGGKWGICELYAALDWARAYKESLEDDATRSRALARYAYSLTTPGGSRAVQAAKERLSTTFASGASLSNRETNPPPVTGSTFLQSEGVDLEPIRLSGATLPVDHNRALRLMVASATDLPDTMLSGDPDQGNLATATTLDRPTELSMADGQDFWRDTLFALLTYVVDWAIVAPSGPLTEFGMLAPASEGGEGRPTIQMLPDPATGQPYDRHVDVTFPAILERDVISRVQAIVNAFTLGGHPVQIGALKLVTRLLLQALEVDDVDEELTALFPEEDPADDQGEPLVDPATVTEALQAVVGELRRLLEVETPPGTSPASTTDALTEAIAALAARPVHLTVQPPPVTETLPARRVRKSVERDSDGRITAVNEEEV